MSDITSVQSEQVTGRFHNRETAERVAEQLREIGVSPQGISVREGATARKSRAHIGEGLVLGAVVGALLGGLFGAIFAMPSSSLTFFGQNFVGVMAGAVSGIGYGLLLGIVLGLVGGIVSRQTAASPIHDFEELLFDGAFVEANVPHSLAGRAREIVNAA